MKRTLCLILAVIAASVALAQSPAAKTEKEERARLTEISTQQQKAKKAYVAKKSDAKLRKSYVDLTLLLADNYTFAKFLAPKEKYPKGLTYYKEVLAVDPNNKQARQMHDTITAIYKKRNQSAPKP